MVGICHSFQNLRDRGRRINQKFKAILEYKEVQGQLSYKGTWVFLFVWLTWFLFCFVFKGGSAKENRKEKILYPSFLFWKCFEFYNYLHKFNTAQLQNYQDSNEPHLRVTVILAGATLAPAWARGWGGTLSQACLATVWGHHSLAVTC